MAQAGPTVQAEQPQALARLHDSAPTPAMPSVPPPRAPRVEPTFDPPLRPSFQPDPLLDPAPADTAILAADLQTRAATIASVAASRRRWIAATVTVTVVALAVVGIGRPLLDPPVAVAPAVVPPVETAPLPATAQSVAPQLAMADATTSEAQPPAAPAGRAAASLKPPPSPPASDTPSKRPANRTGNAAPNAPSSPNVDKPSSTPPANAQRLDGRYIVQLATYRSEAQARAVKGRVESLGLRSYHQVLQTREGPRYRVRVGPFTARTEAERAEKRLEAARLRGNVRAL